MSYIVINYNHNTNKHLMLFGIILFYQYKYVLPNRALLELVVN